MHRESPRGPLRGHILTTSVCQYAWPRVLRKRLPVQLTVKEATLRVSHVSVLVATGGWVPAPEAQQSRARDLKPFDAEPQPLRSS